MFKLFAEVVKGALEVGVLGAPRTPDCSASFAAQNLCAKLAYMSIQRVLLALERLP